MRLPPLFFVLFFALFAPTFTYAEEPPLPDFKNIVLPPNPARGDVTKFLKNLEKGEIDYAQKAKRFSTLQILELQENITSRLNEIPSDHIELILEKVPSFLSFIRFRGAYIRSVISRTDLTPKHAEIIGRNLQYNSDLIEVINRYKWEPLLEKQIIKGAQTLGSYALLPKYAESLARLNTPAAKKLLPELLARDNALVMTDAHYAVYRICPEGIDWPKTVAKTWENAKNDPENVHFYAPIAASQGITEALILIAKKLNSNAVDVSPFRGFGRTIMRRALRQLVDVQLATEQELIQYVLDNRDRLSFDRENSVYIVK